MKNTNPKLKTNTINPRNGSKRDAFDDLMQNDESAGMQREGEKLAKKEKAVNIPRLERIIIAQKKLSEIKRGISHLAIAAK